MTRIYTAIQIERPVEQVFQFVTPPANWPQWHPSSLGVSAGADHSLQVGEQVVEEFLVAGRRGRVVWTVREREEPGRWVIAGEIVGRNNGGVITYQLSAKAGGTFFEREFVYETPGVIFPLLDWLVVRGRVERESAEAVRRLKAALER